VPTNEDHANVGEPHGKRQQNLGVEKVGRADGLLSDNGTDEQTGGHAGQAEEQCLQRDLVCSFERRQPGDCRRLLFEAMLLQQV